MGNGDGEITGKKVAFYSSLLNAWVQTRMETDKTLIVISSAGIGFLISLLTREKISCLGIFIVYLAALISFLLVIAFCITIFHRNSSYIAKLIKNPDAGDVEDRCLEILDWLSKTFFALALIFTLVIGILTALDQLYKQ